MNLSQEEGLVDERNTNQKRGRRVKEGSMMRTLL